MHRHYPSPLPSPQGERGWIMRLLITAGPTREPIDAVRFISNRSSGRLGWALAHAGLAARHEVTLLMGPGVCDEPIGAPADRTCRLYRFGSSAELKQLLEAHFRDCDVLIMAAAVSDYRPQVVAEGKLSREPGVGMTIQLEATPDLVALTAATKRAGQRVIAFALEDAGQLEARAAEKLRR